MANGQMFTSGINRAMPQPIAHPFPSFSSPGLDPECKAVLQGYLGIQAYPLLGSVIAQPETFEVGATACLVGALAFSSKTV
jgi:hypothetical protein